MDFFNGNNNNNNGNKGFGGIFKDIVAKANNELNSDRAKAIKKKLITYGGIGAAVGVLMIIVGMILFMSSGFGGMNFGGIIGGMIVFMLGGIVSGIGISALQAGISIVIAGESARIVDTADRCPKCGDVVTPDEQYCDKCGTPVLKSRLCSCGKQNDVNSKYCKACGRTLDRSDI